MAEVPRRGRRVLRRILVTAVVVIAVAYAAVGWYVSGEIIDGIVVEDSPIEYDTDILAIDGSEIRLQPPEDEATVEADRDAVMGLRWEGGYAQIGPSQASTNRSETRSFTLLDGDVPSEGEDVADYDSFAFPGDPANLGLDFETVTYPGPDGNLEAWYVLGEGGTWLIGVHGIGSNPAEFLRLLDTVDDLTYPFLGVRYRNDPGMPASGDSLILAGQEEWADVEAAVNFAASRGARDVVIYAPSMGGALTLNYAMRAERGLVRALILEAPVADLRQVVELRSGEALPIGGPIGDSILAVGRAFVWMRTGLDFDEVDYIDRADELSMPILLWHGTEDERIPVEIGEALAAARSDLVEFHRLEDAAHVRAWNEGPEEYASVLRAFLERVGRSG
jgi:uncharacterized protein